MVFEISLGHNNVRPSLPSHESASKRIGATHMAVDRCCLVKTPLEESYSSQGIYSSEQYYYGLRINTKTLRRFHLLEACTADSAKK